MGPPIWSNGRRCPFPMHQLGSFPYAEETLALRYLGTSGNDTGSEWGPTTFVVAEGL